MRRSLVLPLVSTLLLAGCGDLFNTAAATVDGRKIDEEQFTRELDFLLADPRLAQQLPQGEAGELQRKELARNYLTFLIHQQLVEAYADQRDIEVPGDEIDSFLDAQIGELGGQAAFDELLRQAGVTRQDVGRLLEQQLLRQAVAEDVVAEEVSEESLHQVYEERALEFSRVHVAHILVSTEKRAQRIRDQATPKNFADLARRFSEDPGSAENGGDLGTQRASDLVGPFAQAAVDIPVGDIGGPVQTEFGFHVIHVLERQAEPFEAAREQLLQEVRGDVFTGWLLARIGEAEIRVNPRYGFFDEASGQVLERTSSTPSPQPSVQVVP